MYSAVRPLPGLPVFETVIVYVTLFSPRTPSLIVSLPEILKFDPLPLSATPSYIWYHHDSNNDRKETIHVSACRIREKPVEGG